MCGIVYVRRKDNQCAVRAVVKRYDFQKERGRQGFGYVAAACNKIVSYERDETEQGILDKLNVLARVSKETNTPVGEILYHHRYPTSTPNTENTAHPIHVSNPILKYDYYVVHNGVVTNPTMLRTEHEKYNFEYTTEVECVTYQRVKYGKDGKKLPKHKRITEEVITTKFNDSEALAIELAMWNEGLKEEVKATGSYAFIVWKVEKDTRILRAVSYGRKSSPLKIDGAYELNAITSLNPSKDIEDIEEGIMYTSERDDDGNTTSTSERVFEKKYEYTGFGFPTHTHPNTTYSGANSTDDYDPGFAPGYGNNVKSKCDMCDQFYLVKHFPSKDKQYRFTCRYCLDHIFTNVGKNTGVKTLETYDPDDDDDEVVGRTVNLYRETHQSSLYSYDTGTKQLVLTDGSNNGLTAKEEEMLQEWYEVMDEITYYEEQLELTPKETDANEYWENYAALDALRQRKIEIEQEIDIEEYTV